LYAAVVRAVSSAVGEDSLEIYEGLEKFNEKRPRAARTLKIRTLDYLMHFYKARRLVVRVIQEARTEREAEIRRARVYNRRLKTRRRARRCSVGNRRIKQHRDIFFSWTAA